MLSRSIIIASTCLGVPLSVALAPQTANAQVIYACKNNFTGALRVVAQGAQCPRNWSHLDWNAAGPSGPQGMAGPQGEAGLQGPAGPQGLRGEVGPAGAPGVPGAAGERGQIGMQGAQGERGEPGPPGPAGAKGEAGLQGPAGAPGAAGERGQIGIQGAQGERGEPGPPGPAGPAGASNVRAFEVTGDTASCQADEILVSALCQGAGGQPLLQNGRATCSGASGIVGLCIRR